MTCTLCLDYLRNNDPTAIKLENETCIYVEFPHEVLECWGMILPKRHCETVFELSEVEIKDSFQLLSQIKEGMDATHGPHGFNVGWNCYPVAGQATPHAHMHIIGRFEDEPMAGKGIRHWLKKNENSRANKE